MSVQNKTCSAHLCDISTFANVLYFSAKIPVDQGQKIQQVLSSLCTLLYPPKCQTTIAQPCALHTVAGQLQRGPFHLRQAVVPTEQDRVHIYIPNLMRFQVKGGGVKGQ